MRREEAEELLVMADRLWMVGARGRDHRIAHALEEWAGERGFDGDTMPLFDGEGPEPTASLLDEPQARATDPETSAAAAASVEDMRRNQRAVHLALAQLGEATDEALVERYQERMERGPGSWPRQSPSGIRTRRHELEVVGLVEDTGKRAKISTGRQAIVWRAIERRRT